MLYAARRSKPCEASVSTNYIFEEVVCDDHPCEMTKLEVERCVITGLNVLESPKKVAMCLAQFGDRYP